MRAVDRPGAGSGDLSGYDGVGLAWAAAGIGHAVGELPNREEAVGFHDAACAVHPGGLDGVGPGALDRQTAGDDTDARAVQLDLPIVVADPVAHLLADVPGRVVQIRRASLASARSRSRHQAGYSVVTALTVRPSTKRGQVASCRPPSSVAERSSRP